MSTPRLRFCRVTKPINPWVRSLLLTLFVMGMGCGLFWGILRLLPAPPLLGDLSESRIVTDRDGTWLTVTLNDEGQYRRFVTIDALAPALKAATLRYEDQYFYQHPGVNPVSLIRAAWASLWGRPIGASTITMQVARLRLGLNTRTLTGKLSQILWALRYEAHYSKATILATYLNLAPYGGNVEGAEAAAHLYFGKAAKDLTPVEAVSLSVVPQNPVKRAPLTGVDFISSRNRALDLAQTQGALSARLVLVAKADTTRPTWHWPFFEPHVTRHVLATEKKARVHTTIDKTLSENVRQLLRQTRSEFASPQPNGAVFVMDGRTGDVLVHVGSADFFDTDAQGQVDGLLARRSPGSTLKPFIYSEALEKGLIHSESLVFDIPLTQAGWTPENADGTFMGPMRAAPALALSRNLPAIRLFSDTQGALYELLTKVGVPLKDKDHYGLSLALGTAEVSPVTLAQLYSAFVNDGLLQVPRYDVNDTPSQPLHRLMSPEVAWITRHMLLTPNGVEDAWERDQPNPTVTYFKTGTSHGRRDAWTVGTVGPYVVVVWLGHFSGASHAALQGPTAAAPLFLTIAERLKAHPLYGTLIREWVDTRPARVSTLSVCDETGDASRDRQGDVRCSRTRLAYVIPGVSPVLETGFWVKRPVDKETGAVLCTQEAGKTTLRYVLTWPDFLRPYVPQTQAPKVCEKTTATHATASFTWVSPAAGQRYLTGTASRTEATVLGEVRTPTPQTLAWFDGDRFLGHFPSNRPVVLTLKGGVHVLSVQIPNGARQTRTIEVKSP